MCGIIAITSHKPVYQRILVALRQLQYRGYDSAGIAVTSTNGIQRWRQHGKIDKLAQAIDQNDAQPNGCCGLGHTRWATHGRPNTENAHPHATEQVAVVHNGIIENFHPLKTSLQAKGACFTSQTDSEVIAHLVTEALVAEPPLRAVQHAIAQLEGSFALAFVFKQEPELIIVARQGSPLVIGIGDNECFISSDTIALSALTHNVIYLADGDVASLSPDQIAIYDAGRKKVQRPQHHIPNQQKQAEKNGFPHYMLKEIYEQPTALSATLASLVEPESRNIVLPALMPLLEKASKIHIVACGTSYYAGLVARNVIERYARIPVQCDYASEFRYRQPVLHSGQPCLFISQSGETADTLAALKIAQQHDCVTIALVNVEQSALARSADHSILTQAGTEIGVASTKAFTTQMLTLIALALACAQTDIQNDMQALIDVPSHIEQILQQDQHLRSIAQIIAQSNQIMTIGRDTAYPIALEAALKLKEIGYIHAHAHAAGEMKHGPIALIDKTMPVIVIAPPNETQIKTLSNMEEIAARGGRLILISDADTIENNSMTIDHSCAVPLSQPSVYPILYTIPIQLLAYHTAVCRHNDVDQPRNLAKAVTVE